MTEVEKIVRECEMDLRKEGRERGEAFARREIAKKLKGLNQFTDDFIAEIVGLPVKKIEKL